MSITPPGPPAEADVRIAAEAALRLARKHLRAGWWLLLVFLTLGIALEGLIGYRVRWFTEDGVRQTMWRLAHAHGTLLALVNIAFGLTAASSVRHTGRLRLIASPCLLSASLALPLGFFVGGLWTYAGMPTPESANANDPGVGIVLVTLGAVLLAAAVLLTALGLRK